MSAFVVDREHIEYLIEAGLYFGFRERGPLTWLGPGKGSYESRRRELNSETASQVGQVIWAENHRSVSYRYEEAQACPEYRHVSRALPMRLDPVQVLKSIACLDYQSCECPDWEETEAYAFLERLRDAAIHALPGYEAATWGAPERARVRA
jgi:hypothetical protein